MKKIIREFRDFISRGNVMDLAVGVIIGSVFTSIVNSLVNDIIMPLMSLFISGIDFTGLSVEMRPLFGGSPVVFSYGNFLSAAINFLIVAISVFIIIKTVNPFRRMVEKDFLKLPEKDSEKEKIEIEQDRMIQLLTEIRDALKANQIGNGRQDENDRVRGDGQEEAHD